MGRQIEKSGKTVDEAIWNGVQEMGLSVDEVDIEILQKGSLGLLGIGAKPAIVRLTEKEQEAIDVKSMFDIDSASGKKTPLSSEKSQRPEHTKSDSNPKRHEKKAHTPKVSKPIEYVEVQPEDIDMLIEEASASLETDTDHAEAVEATEAALPAEIEYSEEFANNNTAAKFLSDLLSRMNVDAKVLAAIHDNSLKIRIDTESAGVLIGHRGETLDALQYITLLVANRDRSQNEYTRVSIDTQGYREKREEVLVRLAKSKASTVRASGKPYKFEPMSPYERRIIHATLQSNSHVTTHSEGVEPYRYVVITSTHAMRRPRRKQERRYSSEATAESNE